MIAQFLRRESWQVVRAIDLGTTARVLVVERDGERWALKTRRHGTSDTTGLLTEYRLLRYLNATPMRPYVPRLEAWLPDVGGFLMEHLRYPTRAEKERADWTKELARALRALHDVDLPRISGLMDDRPDVGRAVSQRFGRLFATVLRTGYFWTGLSAEDRPKLERLRAHYPAYARLLSQVSAVLAQSQVALTHGDLAGDNLMLTQEGRLAITDWGSARISAAWLDVASLRVYMDWSPDQRSRFCEVYFGGPSEAHKEALRSLDQLARLHRYRSCVQSLLWLREGAAGLDAVGRTFFDRQLDAL